MFSLHVCRLCPAMQETSADLCDKTLQCDSAMTHLRHLLALYQELSDSDSRREWDKLITALAITGTVLRAFKGLLSVQDRLARHTPHASSTDVNATNSSVIINNGKSKRHKQVCAKMGGGFVSADSPQPTSLPTSKRNTPSGGTVEQEVPATGSSKRKRPAQSSQMTDEQIQQTLQDGIDKHLHDGMFEVTPELGIRCICCSKEHGEDRVWTQEQLHGRGQAVAWIKHDHVSQTDRAAGGTKVRAAHAKARTKYLQDNGRGSEVDVPAPVPSMAQEARVNALISAHNCLCIDMDSQQWKCTVCDQSGHLTLENHDRHCRNIDLHINSRGHKKKVNLAAKAREVQSKAEYQRQHQAPVEKPTKHARKVKRKNPPQNLHPHLTHEPSEEAQAPSSDPVNPVLGDAPMPATSSPAADDQA